MLGICSWGISTAERDPACPCCTQLSAMLLDRLCGVAFHSIHLSLQVARSRTKAWSTSDLKLAIAHFCDFGVEAHAILHRSHTHRSGIQQLIADGQASLTPSGAYDDAFLIEYARGRPHVWVCSCDLYRDFDLGDVARRKIMYAWICGEFTPDAQGMDGLRRAISNSKETHAREE